MQIKVARRAPIRDGCWIGRSGALLKRDPGSFVGRGSLCVASHAVSNGVCA